MGVHLVDEANLDLVSDPELPVDRGVRSARVTIDESGESLELAWVSL
jgi:hypothetical protein